MGEAAQPREPSVSGYTKTIGTQQETDTSDVRGDVGAAEHQATEKHWSTTEMERLQFIGRSPIRQGQ